MRIQSVLLTTFLILFAGTLLAQKPLYRPQVHEIDFQLGELHQLPQLNTVENMATPVMATPLNGIWYKYHFTVNHAVRAGINYRNTNFSLPNGIDNFESYDVKRRDYEAMLGYQYSAPLGRATFYTGVDALLTRSHSQENGVQSDLPGTLYAADYTQMRLGGKGFVGLKLYLSPHVSLGLEAGPYFQRALSAPNGDASYTIFNTDEFGFRSSALLSFHFKQMKKRCTCPRH